MGLRRSTRIRKQEAEQKRQTRSRKAKKKPEVQIKQELTVEKTKQKTNATKQKEKETTRRSSRRARTPVPPTAEKKTKEPKKSTTKPTASATNTKSSEDKSASKRKPRAKKRAPEKVEKVSVIVAPAAKKKRAATKAWTKAQKVTVIQPLALAIKKQETTGESSNEQIRRSKREDNQIQRDLDYQQNVICRDRRSCFVLKATVRFLQSSEILKRKHQYDQQHAVEMNDNPFGNQVGTFDGQQRHEIGDVIDMGMHYPTPCPERHIIPQFDLTKGVNNIIIHPDMDSNTISFPKKIWYVVNSPECKSIWWYSDGRSFIINKRWIKEKGELLDGRKYTTGISMNISDYSSLVRQLNLYGFRKVKRCLGSEMTEFQTHYMAAMTERHPFSEIVGKAALQDLDEFRHTFFTTSDIRLPECRLGEEKVQFIKRQKPFKPTNVRKMPEKFDPKIRKSSATRPSRHHVHTPSSHYSDESQSYFPAYGDARYSGDSDDDMPISAFNYNSAPFPGPWGAQAPPFLPTLPFDPQSAAEQLSHEFPFPLFKN